MIVTQLNRGLRATRHRSVGAGWTQVVAWREKLTTEHRDHKDTPKLTGEDAIGFILCGFCVSVVQT
jgi:hypothetical protein